MRMTNLLLAFVVFLSGCSSSESKRILTEVNNRFDTSKVLIVYLSRTNNTKAVAEIIHSNTGGKLVSIELKNPYPADYQATVQQVVKENETGFFPPLKTTVDSIEQFDILFVGFPK